MSESDPSVSAFSLAIESSGRGSRESGLNGAGKPCIRGTRLTVRRVVEVVALYPDCAELKQEYPELEDDDIRQALQFAACKLDDQIIALWVT